MRHVPDNALHKSADFARVDHLLKSLAILSGAGVVLGIALYVALGLGVGA